MADSRITDLAALTGANIATGDQFELVDVSDTSMAATGTDKKMTAAELKIALATTLGIVAIDKIFDAKGDLPIGTGADAAAKLTVGAAGLTLVPNSNETTGLQWVGPPHPVPASGEYIMTQMSTGLVGFSTATTLNRVEFCPIWIPSRLTFDRIAFYVQSLGSAGAVVRLGVYASTTAGKPGTLSFDAGTVATDSGGALTSITISQTLDPGLYYTALVSQTAVCTPRNVATQTSQWSPRSTAADALTNLCAQYWVQDTVTGALPSTATPVASSATSNRGPFHAGLRVT